MVSKGFGGRRSIQLSHRYKSRTRRDIEYGLTSLASMAGPKRPMRCETRNQIGKPLQNWDPKNGRDGDLLWGRPKTLNLVFVGYNSDFENILRIYLCFYRIFAILYIGKGCHKPK